jgi:hypothetical protein
VPGRAEKRRREPRFDARFALIEFLPFDLFQASLPVAPAGEGDVSDEGEGGERRGGRRGGFGALSRRPASAFAKKRRRTSRAPSLGESEGSAGERAGGRGGGLG